MTALTELPLSALGWPGLPRDARLDPTPVLMASSLKYKVDETYLVTLPNGQRHYYTPDPRSQSWEFYGMVD